MKSPPVRGILLTFEGRSAEQLAATAGTFVLDDTTVRILDQSSIGSEPSSSRRITAAV